MFNGLEFLCATKVNQISLLVDDHMPSTGNESLIKNEQATKFVVNYFNGRTMPVRMKILHLPELVEQAGDCLTEVLLHKS